MVILVSPLHSKNTPSLILVTPSGIIISDESLLQLLNAAAPIVVTLSGIVIFVRLLQASNASAPILVTPSGITIVGTLLHLKNA